MRTGFVLSVSLLILQGCAGNKTEKAKENADDTSTPDAQETIAPNLPMGQKLNLILKGKDISNESTIMLSTLHKCLTTTAINMIMQTEDTQRLEQQHQIFLDHQLKNFNLESMDGALGKMALCGSALEVRADNIVGLLKDKLDTHLSDAQKREFALKNIRIMAKEYHSLEGISDQKKRLMDVQFDEEMLDFFKSELEKGNYSQEKYEQEERDLLDESYIKIWKVLGLPPGRLFKRISLLAEISAVDLMQQYVP